MSHTVYLTASDRPRMPDGSAGEWKDFYFPDRAELEAKNWPPLLWWCLFGEEDLREARPIDELDAGTREGDEERAEMMEEMGEEATAPYPYLVAEASRAVQRLERRRDAVLAGLLPVHARIYDGFAGLIGQAFEPYVLLRPAGLIDATKAGPAMRRMAAEMDALDAGGAPGPGIRAMVEDVRRWPAEDPVWLLSGAGPAGVWPTPFLAASVGRRAGGEAPSVGAEERPGTGGRGAALAWIAAALAAVAAAWWWLAG